MQVTIGTAGTYIDNNLQAKYCAQSDVLTVHPWYGAVLIAANLATLVAAASEVDVVTTLSKFIPPSAIQKSAGTWTPTVASDVCSDVRTAGDASFTLLIPIELPAWQTYYRNGSKLISIEVFYKIATLAADDFATVALEKIALPVTGSAPTGAAVTCTIDAGHDTAGERKATGDHTMKVTLTTSEWINNGYAYVLVLVVDAAATTDFTLYGARVNFAEDAA
jgi:hypothetical protein